MLMDFDQMMLTALESHHLNRTDFDKQVNRFLRWTIAWEKALRRDGWTSIARAPRKVQRQLLQRGYVASAPFDLVHPKTGQMLCFMPLDSCPRCIIDVTKGQARDESTTVLIYGDPQAHPDKLDSNGNLSGILDSKQQAWCLSVNGIVDYLGRPYQVAPDSSLGLGRLIPSTDPAVLALFKQHRFNQ